MRQRNNINTEIKKEKADIANKLIALVDVERIIEDFAKTYGIDSVILKKDTEKLKILYLRLLLQEVKYRLRMNESGGE